MGIIPESKCTFPKLCAPARDTLTVYGKVSLLSTVAEVFASYVPKRKKRIDSMAEIVDRILQAANENSRSRPKARNLRHGQVEVRNFRVKRNWSPL